MTTRGAAARSANADREFLKDQICRLLRIDPTTWDAHDIRLAFQAAGIDGWDRHFTSLSYADIDQLTVPDTPPRPLALMHKSMLRAVRAFHVHCCVVRKQNVNIAGCTEDLYDMFRVNIWDPEEPLRAWNSLKRAPKLEDEVANWRKSVRPSRSDYKEFRDEAYWQQTKEKIEATAKSHGLYHTLDSSHVVSNRELDELQRQWMMKTLQEIMIVPRAKSIVTKHADAANTRLCWKEIVDHFALSRAAEMRASTLATYMNSARLNKINWRGTKQNAILHWKEQHRLHNLLAKSPYTDEQSIAMLNNFVSGVIHLQDVLDNHRTSSKAALMVANASRPTGTAPITAPPLSLEEYVELLQQACQATDANPITRPRRQANVTEFVFDDGEIAGVPAEDDYGLQAHVHDIDTNVEDLLYEANVTDTRNSSSNGPRPVRMNASTWRSLSPADQTAWDKVTDDGKRKILGYAENKAKERNSFQQKTNPSYQRQVRVHEQEQSASPDIPEETPQMEANVRESDKSKQPSRSLLKAATTKNKSEEDYTINHLLASKQKKTTFQSNSHEWMPRSDFTPSFDTPPSLEINMHFMDFDKALQESMEIAEQEANASARGDERLDSQDDVSMSGGGTQESQQHSTATTSAPTSTAPTNFIDDQIMYSGDQEDSDPVTQATLLEMFGRIRDQEDVSESQTSTSRAEFDEALALQLEQAEAYQDSQSYLEQVVEESPDTLQLTPGKYTPKHMGGRFKGVLKPTVPAKDRIVPKEGAPGFELLTEQQSLMTGRTTQGTLLRQLQDVSIAAREASGGKEPVIHEPHQVSEADQDPALQPGMMDDMPDLEETTPAIDSARGHEIVTDQSGNVQGFSDAQYRPLQGPAQEYFIDNIDHFGREILKLARETDFSEEQIMERIRAQVDEVVELEKGMMEHQEETVSMDTVQLDQTAFPVLSTQASVQQTVDETKDDSPVSDVTPEQDAFKPVLGRRRRKGQNKKKPNTKQPDTQEKKRSFCEVALSPFSQSTQGQGSSSSGADDSESTGQSDAFVGDDKSSKDRAKSD